MYGSRYNYGGKSPGPKRMPQVQTQQEIHIHQEAHNPPVLGTIGFVIAVIVLLLIILMMLGVIKNNNNQKVMTGTATNSCYFVYSGSGGTAEPAAGWHNNYGSITFSPGYWLVTLYVTIYSDTSSIYAANAVGANLTNYSMGLSTESSTSASPPPMINNSSENSTTGDIWSTTNTSSYDPEGTGVNGLYFGSNSPSTNYSIIQAGSYMNMPTITIYVNTPVTQTYYIIGQELFSTPVAGVLATQSPFTCTVNYVVTKLGNVKNPNIMPYSTYMPIASTVSGGSGTSGSKSSGSSGTSGSKSSGSSGTSGSTFSGFNGKSTFVRNMQRPMMQRPMMYHSMM